MKNNSENKKRIGISIYPEKIGLQKTLNYIEKAAQSGFSRVFTNLLEIQNDENGKSKLKIISECLKYAQKLGMATIVDVNRDFYAQFNYQQLEVEPFMKLGANGIRLDEDFKGKVEAAISQKIWIELNASAGINTTKATLDKGGKRENITACHNFYPQKFTGLDYGVFCKLSKWFKSQKVKVAAFVTLPKNQRTIGPWEVNDGMPTIEEHRYATLSEQIRHMLATNVVDDILISQQPASLSQLSVVKKLFANNVKYMTKQELFFIQKTVNNFPYLEEFAQQKLDVTYEIEDVQDMTHLENLVIFSFPHVTRRDETSYFIRSSFPRIFFAQNKIPFRATTKKYFDVGDVVVLNENYGRYNSEVQILKKKIINDGKRNYVGKIKKFDHILVKYSIGGTKFRLVKVI